MKTSVNERFREVVAENKFSATYLAKIAGISQTTISRQIKGDYNVSIESIYAVLHECPEISADWLLMGKGEKYVSESLPKMTGDENEEIKDLHAQIAKLTAEKNGLLDRVARLEGEKENDNRTIQAQEKTIVLYERENDRLVKQNEKITRENMRLKGEPVEEKRKSV